MSLLTYDWKPTDPTGAVSNYLSGIKSGSQLGESILQAYQFRQKLEQQQQQIAAAEAMRLAYEARVLEGERLRQGVATTRENRLAEKARADAQPWDPLPESSAPPGSGAPGSTAPLSGAEAVLGQPVTGDLLNRSANTEGPMRSTTDFAGDALPTEDFGGQLPPQNTAADLLNGIGGRYEPLQSSPLIEAQNATGGAAPPLGQLDPAGVETLTGGGPVLGGGPAPVRAARVPIGGRDIIGALPAHGADMAGPGALMNGVEPSERTIQNVQYKIIPKGAMTGTAADRVVKDPASNVLSPWSEVWTADERKLIRASGLIGGRKEVLKTVQKIADAKIRSQTPTSKPKVRANLQDADGGMFTQYTDGSWEGGKSPAPGQKVFTIGSPGRPSTSGAALEWHADGSVTSKNGRVYHYNSEGTLEPASVPKGKTVKNTLSGDDGLIHTQFSDGTWDTADGQTPEGIKLTRLPGATEEKRTDIADSRNKEVERKNTETAIRNDRAHFDREADQSAIEAEKLSKTKLEWPWENGGKFFKMNAKGRPVAIGQSEADTMRAKAQGIKDRIDGYRKAADESTSKAAAAQARLEAFEKTGVIPEVAPAPAPAAAAAPAAADDKVEVISPDGVPGRIPRSQLAAALKAGYKEK